MAGRGNTKRCAGIGAAKPGGDDRGREHVALCRLRGLVFGRTSQLASLR